MYWPLALDVLLSYNEVLSLFIFQNCVVTNNKTNITSEYLKNMYSIYGIVSTTSYRINWSRQFINRSYNKNTN